MTKEYKQIEVFCGEYRTMDFKKAIKYVEEHKLDRLVFHWSPKARTSSAEFEARIAKVLGTLTKWVFTHELIDDNNLEVLIQGGTDD